MSSESSSESEISACSSKFDPIKALYANEPKLPIKTAPLYDNLQQFEATLKYESTSIIPIGHRDLVLKREEEKEMKKKEQERLLQEKNKQRFAQYEGTILRLCFYFCYYLMPFAHHYDLIF